MNQNAVISAERGPAMNTALGSLLSRPYYDAALSSLATYKRKRCDFRRAESPGWMAINCGVGQPCAKMPRVRNLILFTETLSKKAMKKALKCLGLNGFRGLWPLAGVAGILLGDVSQVFVHQRLLCLFQNFQSTCGHQKHPCLPRLFPETSFARHSSVLHVAITIIGTSTKGRQVFRRLTGSQ
jgi:hypothetical protein